MDELMIRGIPDAGSLIQFEKPEGPGKANKGSPTEKGSGFSEMLDSSVGKVNESMVKANQLSEDLVTGKTDNIHEVMLSLEKADLNFKLLMEVRNRLMDGYHELSRMQI